MSSITVKVTDLWAALNLMKKDGMSQVSLSIIEGDDSPAFIALEATSKKELGFHVGYDDVEEIHPDELLF